MRQHLQTLFIVVVGILGTLVYVEATGKKNNSPWSNGFAAACQEAITNMYADYIDEWKNTLSVNHLTVLKCKSLMINQFQM